ncbi:MAG: hypothetical protein ACRDID_13435 [Ktedonobacterales bacterium]|jgi:hypothetical protein
MADVNTPVEAYGQLDQAQRTQLAQTFLEEMKKEDHASYDRYAHVDLNTVTAEQLADMHNHAAAHHKNAFGVVMDHPIMTAALAGFAVYELDRHLGKR